MLHGSIPLYGALSVFQTGVRHAWLSRYVTKAIQLCASIVGQFYTRRRVTPELFAIRELMLCR
jgi:hypothetical protein